MTPSARPSGGRFRVGRAPLTKLKAIGRRAAPQRALLWRKQRVIRRYQGDDPADVFARIYRDGIWGRQPGERFSSGAGTRDVESAAVYVRAVLEFLGSLPAPPIVVDLGCGDFDIGGQLSGACGHYVGCDVVPELIEHNRARFQRANVEFRRLDLVTDELPSGDVAIIRQVLQHLSNEHIRIILPKLGSFEHVLVTEHIPAGSFEPNTDKPTGPDTRLDLRPPSGVVPTAPPFGWPVETEHILCEVRTDDAIIRTTHFRPQGRSGGAPAASQTPSSPRSRGWEGLKG